VFVDLIMHQNCRFQGWISTNSLAIFDFRSSDGTKDVAIRTLEFKTVQRYPYNESIDSITSGLGGPKSAGYQRGHSAK
jgi:hypothetical protein